MAISKVGVLGCGLMGGGIAQVSAQAGFPTLVREPGGALVEKGLKSVTSSMAKGVERGKLSQEEMDKALANIKGTTELKELSECDIVIEAIPEEIELKKENLKLLDSFLKPSAIIASNTSSLSITELAMATGRPERVLGLHFFSPVPLMKLVEVVRTLMTAEDAFKSAWDFAVSLGKEPVACKDSTGFIVNRLLVPYLLDAIRAYEEGAGSLEDIDKGMKLGCGYPMGPFTLMDMVGLDITYNVANIMYEEFRESRFAPPPLLKRMVAAGRLGRKTGRGFYEYGK
ncbi:MAG: 3-hydroxyacyl-CoA dehydrogenase family protein [Nitrospinota bacterium]